MQASAEGGRAAGGQPWRDGHCHCLAVPPPHAQSAGARAHFGAAHARPSGPLFWLLEPDFRVSLANLPCSSTPSRSIRAPASGKSFGQHDGGRAEPAPQGRANSRVSPLLSRTEAGRWHANRHRRRTATAMLQRCCSCWKMLQPRHHACSLRLGLASRRCAPPMIQRWCPPPRRSSPQLAPQ